MPAATDCTSLCLRVATFDSQYKASLVMLSALFEAMDLHLLTALPSFFLLLSLKMPLNEAPIIGGASLTLKRRPSTR